MTIDLQDVRARVRTLANAGKLDKRLIAPEDLRLPWSEWCWLCGAAAVVALAFQIAGMALRAAPDDEHPPVPDLLHAGALVLLVGVFFGLAKLVSLSPVDRKRRRLLRGGEVVPAAIVQANQAWFAADNDAPFPGSIVLSFDPRAASEPDTLRAVADELAELKQQDRRTLPEPQAKIAWDLYHEMVPTPALPVPPELARGLTDTWFGSAVLPATPIEYGDTVLVLALDGERDPDGRSVLPASLLDE